jgi:hypothetical protein
MGIEPTCPDFRRDTPDLKSGSPTSELSTSTRLSYLLSPAMSTATQLIIGLQEVLEKVVKGIEVILHSEPSIFSLVNLRIFNQFEIGAYNWYKFS